ncbi:MAG TPA: transposase [Longimicrobiales bacterium]|nr:transposase [Longimicrobiales bacterium]
MSVSPEKLHPRGMPRYRRVYLPGAVFHVTARTQAKEHCFSESICNDILIALAECLIACDSQLVAFALMSNHVHLVIRQGKAPLADLMQPWLRRIALRIHRTRSYKGHVFETRYFAEPCSDAEHVRNIIAYTHRNPVEAGLCRDPADYAWSSHRAYIGTPHPVSACANVLVPAIQLFAASDERSVSDLRDDYMVFYRWRKQVADAKVDPENAPLPFPRPPTLGGDAHFAKYYRTVRHQERSEAADRLDLRDIALNVLAELAPGLPLRALKFRYGGRAMTRVRREIAERALAVGYRGNAIARALNISEASVSVIRSKMLRRIHSKIGQT